MTVDLRKNMKKTSVFKKRPNVKKTRSVQSLIAKNKKVLQKLKPQESSSDESDDLTESSEEETVGLVKPQKNKADKSKEDSGK